MSHAAGEPGSNDARRGSANDLLYQAVTIPAGPETVGHGTHTNAAVWKKYLAEILRSPER